MVYEKLKWLPLALAGVLVGIAGFTAAEIELYPVLALVAIQGVVIYLPRAAQYTGRKIGKYRAE